MGDDGFFAADKLVFYSVSARDKGWATTFPTCAQTGTGNYGQFTPRQARRPCREPASVSRATSRRESVSYTFTLKDLAEAK